MGGRKRRLIMQGKLKTVPVKPANADKFDSAPKKNEMEGDSIPSTLKSLMAMQSRMSKSPSAAQKSGNQHAPFQKRAAAETARDRSATNPKPKKPKVNLAAKRDNESFAEFSKRLGRETREAIIKATKEGRTVSKKRRDYLNKKKQKEKEKKKLKELDNMQRSQQLKEKYNPDHIAFGEVAERPPKLDTDRRIAEKKRKQPSSSTSVADEDVDDDTSEADRAADIIKLRQMELYRNRVIEQYQAHKAKKLHTAEPSIS